MELINYSAWMRFLSLKYYFIDNIFFLAYILDCPIGGKRYFAVAQDWAVKACPKGQAGFF